MWSQKAPPTITFSRYFDTPAPALTPLLVTPAGQEGCGAPRAELLRGSHRDYTSGPIGEGCIILPAISHGARELCIESISAAR